MRTEREIEIDAPASLVWDRYTDVERWPEWTASVEELTALDDAALAPGRRYRIKQPRMPALTWAVTELVPGRSWSWEQRSPGGRTVGFHQVTPLAGERTHVRLGVEQTGWLGSLVGRALRGMTARYLDMEAAGLQAYCEARHRAGT